MINMSYIQNVFDLYFSLYYNIISQLINKTLYINLY